MYQVYRNLHNGKLSIKSKKTGLVVGHCDAVVMDGVNFKVSQSGVEKIRRERKKYVVAVVEGNVAEIDGFESYKNRELQLTLQVPYRRLFGKVAVHFNPYKVNTFVTDEGYPVYEANKVIITNTGKMLAVQGV